MTDGVEWSTEVTVGEAIVELLSGRIYRSLPIALKELVSNAWDADAENVQIMFHQDKRQIMIIDDGIGMTKEQLEEYVDIARSSKSMGGKSPGGRPIIGAYGIGILSTIPFCRKVSVQTTKKGSDEVNFLSLSSELWIDTEGRRKPQTQIELFLECPGRTEYDDRIIGEQGTTVLLEDIFPGEWKIIMEPAKPRRKDIWGLDGITRIKWFLSQYAPINYRSDDETYINFFKPSTDYKPMALFLNGEQLYRNSIPDAKAIEESDNVQIADGKIIFRYLIVSPLKTIEPEEHRGLQIRINNVAIGLPRNFDVYRHSGKLHGRMKFVGGEIEIIRGFENQLSLDREDIITCPEWLQFSDFFVERLIKVATLVEALGEAEKSIGALAVSTGVKPKEAEYGFLSERAVRPSTKRKHASAATSKKELRGTAKKNLSRIGYKIEEVPKSKANGPPLVVDHKQKIVFITEDKKDKLPIISYSEGEIFEVEDTVEPNEIIKIINEREIAFNYKHPLFTISNDRKFIKEFVSVIYILYLDNEISETGLEKFNELLLEVFVNKEKED